MKHIFPIAAIFIALTANTCNSVQVDNNAEAKGLKPIDIRSPGFFWMLRPWKEGRLATIDGWGRFAEISFIGVKGMKIRPLTNFPRMELDQMILAYPEHDLLLAKSAGMYHIADLKNKRNKSIIPFWSFDHNEQWPVLIDGNEGLLAFPYYPDYINSRLKNFFIVYNFKTDNIIGEFGNTDDNMQLQYPMDRENILTMTKQKHPLPLRVYLYNWRTGIRTNNELTEKLTESSLISLYLRPLININLKRRYLFAKIRPTRYTITIKVTWEEGFEDVKVTPLNYLVPGIGEEKWLTDMLLSPNGQWATTFVGGYRGVREELIERRAFFHLDSRYPNGISMPVFAEGYCEYHYDWGTFVNHPVHGECFAEEYIRDDRILERRFLRLYKMSEVLAEIERKMADE